MSEMVFDTATLEDKEELLRLRIAYMKADFGSVSEYEEKCMRDRLPDYYDRRLGKDLIVFTARDNGKIVATAYLLVIEKPASSLLHNGLCGEVLSVFTDDDYRHKGICTRLMRMLVDYAKEHDISRVELMATDDGYPVYKKVGFTDKVQKYKDMRIKFADQAT